MKLIKVIILLVVIMIVVFRITSPTAKELSLCFKNYNNKVAAFLKTSQQEQWNKEQLCISGKEAINTQIDCYRKVENTSGKFLTSITWNLLFVINPTAKNLDEKGLIEFHNRNCSQFSDLTI